MKQIPVESRFAAFGKPISRAISRTRVFRRSPTGKQCSRELRLVQPVQEVALVLARIDPAQKFVPAHRLTDPRVVSRRDVLCAELQRMVEKRLELDLGIAEHVGVRRAAGRVFAQELGEHAVLVLGREVDRLEFDADHIGRRGRVDQILARRAVLVVVIVFPVLHEESDDVVTLLLQQPGRDRGVDPARHTDDDTPFAHVSADGCV